MWNTVVCSVGAHIWWVIIEIWQETKEHEQKWLFIVRNSHYRHFIWGFITAWPLIRSRADPDRHRPPDRGRSRSGAGADRGLPLTCFWRLPIPILWLAVGWIRIQVLEQVTGRVCPLSLPHSRRLNIGLAIKLIVYNCVVFQVFCIKILKERENWSRVSTIWYSRFPWLLNMLKNIEIQIYLKIMKKSLNFTKSTQNVLTLKNMERSWKFDQPFMEKDRIFNQMQNWPDRCYIIHYLMTYHSANKI